MEGKRPLSLFLLLATWAIDPGTGDPEFSGIPTTVELDEGTEPNSVVANFSVDCTNSSDVPTTTLKSITPVSSFFNSLYTLSPGNYQVSLSPSAALDARQVSLYVLTFTAHCGDASEDARLFIRVTETEQLVCNGRYTDTGWFPIQVSEDVRPGEMIYRTFLKRRGKGNLTFTTEDASLPFNITPEGILQAPATGFSQEHAGKVFPLTIVVRDDGGGSCRVSLSIQVLPVHHNKVSFSESSVAAAPVPENAAPLYKVTRVQANEKNVLYEIISSDTNCFTIDPETGIIRTTDYLDLKRNPGLAQAQLVVKAYNIDNHADNANIIVNITVLRQNLKQPLCFPAVFVTQIPENISMGYTLCSLSCYDPDSTNSSFKYDIVFQRPQHSFRMEGPHLQVNTTLDYDLEIMAMVKFQYQATILVIDEGSPPQTASIPVLVTVKPVNEFFPRCSQRVFSVPENTEYGYSIGNVNGSDQDYPFNNIEYSIMGADAGVFYVERYTGQLHVLLPLDYELQTLYHLNVILRDLDNDADPSVRRTTTCNITIHVQDVNDNPPDCEPLFMSHHIYSTSASTITQINCNDKDRRSDLTYRIVDVSCSWRMSPHASIRLELTIRFSSTCGFWEDHIVQCSTTNVTVVWNSGNTNKRFHMRGNTLFHNTFSYNRDGIFDPLVFVLLVEVTDGRFSTTVAVVVHVTPWTTTLSTTTTTTTRIPRKPIILHRTVEYWAPDPWFVVVLTLTGALLLSAFGWLLWQFFWRKVPGKISQPLLQNKSKEMGNNYKVTEEANEEEEKYSTELQRLQYQFDGRAQDPVSGQYYLFDSSTGARRWV